MREVIDSSSIPSRELEFVFRNQSLILKNANAIRNGEHKLEYGPDFGMAKTDDIVGAILSRFRNPKDTVVLSGLRRGPNGVININKKIQKHLGIQGQIEIGQGYKIEEGDKVIHTINDYNKGVFNGNIGYI
jgi:exodeoxyribonuclease V alpha subunit